MPAPSGLEPPAVKVFGILHLILAGIGILSGLWGLFSTQMMGMFQGMMPNPGQAKIQMDYMQELWWVTLMNSIFALTLAGLLLTAGLKLVRSQKDGVLWSNRYAWTSIGMKLVTLVITVAFVLPMMNRMMGDVMANTPNMPAGSADTMTTMMRAMMSTSAVISPLISCLYPVLALIFLSRPRVKEWAVR